MIKLSAFSDEASSSIDGQIKALLRNNIYYTELRSVNGKNAMELTPKEAKNFRKQFNDNGISVWSLGSFIGKVDIQKTDLKGYLDFVKSRFDVALAFGTKNVRGFSFYEAYGERNKVLDYLNAIVEVANDYGITFYHENEKDIYGDVLERVIDVLDNVKGIKCVYDPANFIQCGEKAENTLKLLHNRADYFHIKDVVEETGEIVPAGFGNGNINKLVSMIKGDKVLTVEPHLMVFDTFKDMDKTELKNKFHFTSSDQAFDAAIKGIKDILLNNNYKEKEGVFSK